MHGDAPWVPSLLPGKLGEVEMGGEHGDYTTYILSVKSYTVISGLTRSYGKIKIYVSISLFVQLLKS